MIIEDINGRKRECEDVRVLERDGKKWVRAIIVSKKSGNVHYEWYPYDDFVSRNPDLAAKWL